MLKEFLDYNTQVFKWPKRLFEDRDEVEYGERPSQPATPETPTFCYSHHHWYINKECVKRILKNQWVEHGF